MGYTAAAELPHKPKNFCCCQIIVSFSPCTKKYCLQKILPEAHFCSHTFSDSPKIPSSFLAMLIPMLTLKSIQNTSSKIHDTFLNVPSNGTRLRQNAIFPVFKFLPLAIIWRALHNSVVFCPLPILK